MTQPLLDLFGRNPEFFVASGSTRPEVLAFAVVIAFAIPLLALATEVPGARVIGVELSEIALAVARGDLAIWRLPRAWNFGHFHKTENLAKAETDTGVFFAHWTGVPYNKGRAASMARFSRKLHEARA